MRIYTDVAPSRHLARVAAVLFILGCLFVPAAPPAFAHPFGAPAVARMAVHHRTVTVHWSAADDDLVALGHHVGAFDGTAAPGVTGAQILETSEAAKDYVGNGISVAQDGRDCFRHPADLRELTTTGARVVFTCAHEVSAVDVEVNLLTDINGAYRTVLVGEAGAQPERALATANSPVHAMTFEASRVPATIFGDIFAGRLVTFFDAGFAPLVVLAALLLGVAHAMAPGHGKALAAAYLVGRRGRRRDALVLGGAVAVMHTASILVLAIGWYALAETASPQALLAVTGVMQLVAALIVVALGARLVFASRRDRNHAGDDAGHHPAGPWSVRELGVAGVATGLLPSPSAFLVLTTGLLTGRAVYAVVVVSAFGVGLALTVAGVGWIAIRGRDLLESQRWFPLFDRVAIAIPGVAAAAVLATGAVMSALAVMRL